MDESRKRKNDFARSAQGGKYRDPAIIQRFVNHYIIHRNHKEAAIAAGYAAGGAHSMGTKFLKNEEVKKQIALAEEKVKKEGEYTSLKAMDEAQTSMELAMMTGNAMAHCKAVELRAKICGLLIERVDARLLGNFQISITGIDDKPRPIDTTMLAEALCLPKSKDDEEIEAEFSEEPALEDLLGE